MLAWKLRGFQFDSISITQYLVELNKWFNILVTVNLPMK